MSAGVPVVPAEPMNIDGNGNNAQAIHCRFCNEIILQPHKGKSVDVGVLLPNIGARNPHDGEVLRRWWRLTNMMQFENIGFTHGVTPDGQILISPDGVGDAHGAPAPSATAPAPAASTGAPTPFVRFLSCANCDRGPVGVALSRTEFLVAADRVAYH
ncbi:hypothetical protein PAPYR_1944 [Paratrimastix pyriformis]|uniref:Uncharacterized protein n=1 Tax=Paratrimastix pyriformis TaxID=342808 RepID=A0ABQ8UX91_9EUKA|nr:hypothetical protein PAPYR_1944 [Paratrimastix pyriformis]